MTEPPVMYLSQYQNSGIELKLKIVKFSYLRIIKTN